MPIDIDPVELVALGDHWKPCARCGRRWPGKPAVVRGRTVIAYPPTNPCEVCGGEANDPAVAAAAANKVRCDRMRRAGVPKPLLEFSIAENDLAYQRPKETDEEWRQRCRQLGKTGVHKSNARLMQLLLDWRPPRWLVLHGPTGVGKTAWMAGLIGRLLTEEPLKETRDEAGIARLRQAWGVPGSRAIAPGQRTFRRRALPTVLYARIDHLVERSKLRWEEQRNPLEDETAVPVLFLDELGMDEEIAEKEQHVVDRLIGTRADEGRCTVIGTNRTWDELVRKEKPLYGLRVRDRLLDATAVGLGGPSWRG